MNDFEKDIRCELCFRDQFHTKNVHEKALARAAEEERLFGKELMEKLRKQQPVK